MSHLLRRALAPALTLALALLCAVPAFAAPPPLSAQPTALDFGVVGANWGEQSSNVWVQNDGPDPLLIDPAYVSGSGVFRVSWDGCNGQTLNAGQGCNLSVGFDPWDGAAYDGTLHVPVSGGGVLDVPLNGIGGVQQVTLEPQALAFGEVAVGESATRSFTLTSTGAIPFQSFVTIPTGGDVGAFRVLRDGCALQQLVPGQPCTVEVRFAPLAAGAAAARLLMIGGDSEPAMIPLHGTGAAAAAQPASRSTPTDALSATVEAALADVRFDAPVGLPAPYARGRIDLGPARCVDSERCDVTVRPRVFAVAPDGRAIASVRGDLVLWRLDGAGRRATLTLPAGLRGRPALLVARLRTQAAGRRESARTLVVPLVHGRRAGAAVIRLPRR